MTDFAADSDEEGDIIDDNRHVDNWAPKNASDALTYFAALRRKHYEDTVGAEQRAYNKDQQRVASENFEKRRPVNAVRAKQKEATAVTERHYDPHDATTGRTTAQISFSHPEYSHGKKLKKRSDEDGTLSSHPFGIDASIENGGGDESIESKVDDEEGSPTDAMTKDRNRILTEAMTKNRSELAPWEQGGRGVEFVRERYAKMNDIAHEEAKKPKNTRDLGNGKVINPNNGMWDTPGASVVEDAPDFATVGRDPRQHINQKIPGLPNASTNMLRAAEPHTRAKAFSRNRDYLPPKITETKPLTGGPPTEPLDDTGRMRTRWMRKLFG